MRELEVVATSRQGEKGTIDDEREDDNGCEDRTFRLWAALVYTSHVL